MKYNFSGGFVEYKRLLREFKLDKLLMRINKETAEMMSRETHDISYGVKSVRYLLTNQETGITKAHDTFVTAWSLIDLAYNAIIATNDYRGREITKDEELYLLVAATENIREKREEVFLESIPEEGNPDFLMYVWGFAGEQIKIQYLGKALENTSRELYILFEVARRVEGISDISRIIVDETGVDWRVVVTDLFLAWVISVQSSIMSDIDKYVRWDNTLKKQDFYNVIERYTTSYEDVKKSRLGRQILYTRPFLRTKRGECISVNCYLNLFLYEHSILWIVRDYYMKLEESERGTFTSEFGTYFEAYFEEVMEMYLNKQNYYRIPADKENKRADWRLQMGEYRFLIEQKSSLLNLSAKQQESDIEAIGVFTSRNIIKGLHQLEDTEKYFNDGKYIKIVLLYEDYLEAEILDNIFELESCDVINDCYFWLVKIEEMEMILNQYRKDTTVFFDIIEEKIRRETEKTRDGRSLLKIMREKGIVENMHLKQEKFLKYKNFAKDNIEKHISKLRR